MNHSTSTLLATMHQIVTETVKAYQTDFTKHDLDIMAFCVADEEHTGHMIWAVYESGTYAFPQYTTEAIRNGIERPYLFSSATPDQIVRSNETCIRDSSLLRDARFFSVHVLTGEIYEMSRDKAASYPKYDLERAHRISRAS